MAGRSRPVPRRSPARSPPGHGRRPRRCASHRRRSARSWSSETESEVGPSIEMPLSSNRTISRPSLQMAGERGRLVADALHQAAVAGDDVGVVVDQLGAEAGGQMALGQRHADRVGRGPGRAGRWWSRCRSAWPCSGWPGGAGAELAEALQLLQRHVREAGQVEQRVEQHRAVAGRQDEAVAVGPVGMLRVELEEPGPQHGGDVGHAHGHARDGRTWPARPRPWRARGWHWRGHAWLVMHGAQSATEAAASKVTSAQPGRAARKIATRLFARSGEARPRLTRFKALCQLARATSSRGRDDVRGSCRR